MLDNSGPLVAIIVGFVLLKIVFVATLAILNAIKSVKLVPKVKKLSSKITSVENVFEFISGTHLDIYLSMSSNFLRYKPGDNVADLNVFISMITLLFLLYALIFFLFITSKVLEAKNSRRESLLKIYNPYMYLIDGLNIGTGFGAYYKILNVIKDPIIAFSIVLLYKNPFLQVFFPLITLVYFTFKETTVDPIEDKVESMVSKFSKLIFSIILMSYMGLTFTKGKFEPK